MGEESQSPALEPLAYHRLIVEHLRDNEPEIWAWGSSQQTRAEQVQEMRSYLLRETYRLDAATHPELHEDIAAVLVKFDIDAPATVYQAGDGAMNASLCFVPGEIHLLFHGPARAAPPDDVRDAIAEALAARGLKVRAFVGSASFRCDLAILAAGGARYQLGILLDGDGDGDGGDAIGDRYVFQPAILRSFGWKVIDIPTHSWLRDPAAVIAQIEAALHRDPADEDDDPFQGLKLPQPVIAVPAIPAAPEPDPQAELPSTAPGFSEFRFVQGASDKFWKIAVSDAELTVIFGRAGTKGNTVVKIFDTPERARREAAKLIAEKVRKGYSEL